MMIEPWHQIHEALLCADTPIVSHLTGLDHHQDVPIGAAPRIIIKCIEVRPLVDRFKVPIQTTVDPLYRDEPRLEIGLRVTEARQDELRLVVESSDLTTVAISLQSVGTEDSHLMTATVRLHPVFAEDLHPRRGKARLQSVFAEGLRPRTGKAYSTPYARL